MLSFSKYIQSVSFTGHSPGNCDQDLQWEGYIYLAKHQQSGQYMYTKFGYVMSRDRLVKRDSELKTKNNLYIEHVWAVPNPPFVESELKKHLSAFLNKKRIDVPGKSEYVFGIPYDTLKLFVQLFVTSFLVTCNYITTMPREQKARIQALFSGTHYLIIRHRDVTYKQSQTQLKRMIEKDVEGQPVVVVWGKDAEHPEWENKLFLGTLTGKKTATKRAVKWYDTNFLTTDNVPMEWIFVDDQTQYQDTTRVFDVDQALSLITNYQPTNNKRPRNNIGF